LGKRSVGGGQREGGRFALQLGSVGVGAGAAAGAEWSSGREGDHEHARGMSSVIVIVIVAIRSCEYISYTFLLASMTVRPAYSAVPSSKKSKSQDYADEMSRISIDAAGVPIKCPSEMAQNCPRTIHRRHKSETRGRSSKSD
jgi:hypothetical protein